MAIVNGVSVALTISTLMFLINIGGALIAMLMLNN
jgi:hypothetical protein